MKNTMMFTLGTLVLLATAVTISSAAPQEKLRICHVKSDGSAWVTEINEAQFPRHFAHGDQTLVHPTLLAVHDACTPGVD